ncbi:helix-turn-helix domain protein [Caldicellulosiruptor acetigenus I77R1B]|uniref:Helix-turn-helix domain protein n=1 Tax=Caldicellulosiruptor acetigenus (strain ATCC 700853 / DSM 12137 / I77R1B) TaxID=632335 RepID=E4S5U3_CALA7|nr:helix-turn-helix transcriptional regulator [Caldicellulosiruptor acetigenus]ADQ41603.1 helix-turn-helix domain protein [Caldicellulosiruptor acetigenus I77R1B]
MIPGRKIRELRKSKGLSQREFAKLAGLSQSYISELENGIKTNPSLSVIKKISKALKVDIKVFIEEGEQ